MKLTKEEDQVICKFLKIVAEEGGKEMLKLMQFVLMKLSEEAIQMNAAEVALSQVLNYKGEKYNRVWLSSIPKWVKKLWKNVHTKLLTVCSYQDQEIVIFGKS